MTDLPFDYSDFFDDAEIRNLVQAHIINHLEVHTPKPAKPQEVPLPPEVWVNHEPDLDRLREHLDSQDRPSVVLEGDDGVGKTSMAGMLADLLERRFPDGHLYIDLESGDVKTGLRSALARLGVEKPFIVDDTPGLRSQYASMLRDKAILVVVDDAPSPEAAAMFKPNSARSGFLALGLRHTWTGATLTHRLRDLAAEHAAEYLRRACPDLTDDEVESHIRGRAWRPSKLHDLAGMLRSVRRQDRPRTPTEQILEATYAALSEPAAGLYRLLAELPGPSHEPALLEAIGVDDAEVLKELTDANLVALVQGRYRVKARARHANGLPADLVPGVRQAIMYYLRRSQVADIEIMGAARLRLAAAMPYMEVPAFSSKAEALAWMDDNRDALLGAVRAAQLNGWRLEQWALAEAMWPLFSNRPYPELGRQCYATALDGLEDERARARMLICLGRVQVDLGEHEESASNLAEAVRLAGDHVALTASAKEQLGWLYYRQGRMEAARAAYREGLALAERIGRVRMQGLMLKLLGIVHRDQDRHGPARRSFAEAIRRFVEAEDAKNSVEVRFELAALDAAADPDRYLPDAELELEHMKEMGLTKPRVNALKRLGKVLGGAEGQARIDQAKEIERGFGIES